MSLNSAVGSEHVSSKRRGHERTTRNALASSPRAAPVHRCGADRGLALGGIFLGDGDAGGAMTAALAFPNITLGYDRHPVVHHFDTTIPEGSLTAIVGPNGAGKSTLLKGVIGTLAPQEGRVSLGALRREDIAYLPQQSDVDRSFPLSVVDLVAMGLWCEIGAFGSLGRSHRERMAQAIAAVTHFTFLGLAVISLVGGFQALCTLMAVGIMILPAAARFWASGIGGLVIAAVAVAMLSSLSGLLLSYYYSLPSGPAIILVAGLAYGLSLAFEPAESLVARTLPRRHPEA